MKVAVPCNGDRVSPVFDWARDLLLVEHDGSADGSAGGSRQAGSLEGVMPARRPGRLSEMGVEVLLCGGISAELAKAISLKGIRVVAGLAGNVDEVLAAFFSDRLPDPALSLPGWRLATTDGEGTPGRRSRSRHRGRASSRRRSRGGDE